MDANVCKRGMVNVRGKCFPNIYHSSNIEILKIDFGNVRTKITYRDKNSDTVYETTFVEEKTRKV